MRHLRARLGPSAFMAEPDVRPMRDTALTCQCELVAEGTKCFECAVEAVAEWVAQKNLKGRTKLPKRTIVGA